ncbi:DNA-binding transcriptional regulator, LysR family [Jatrophihabitans endophyticus]|uniref:DNA-binding transcriptional regulator, LysR family n=1 Tax=Jatrophihabitans endophyticus TaxID=1206085 RepID=A0A1M5PKX8_9ACTN|nr:LysR family transcriptional regulator [Jatrophihabitans endophyticus]SHH02139.1 DNA-binding transcriptional regulator, LysR family [Jatrophihabitans endophyticus]
MELDPRRLVVLRAVDRYGGVVGAAAALRVSPSAISQQLAMLERETGFVLIDRSRRGGQRSVEFTTAGRRLVGHADALVQVLDDAEADLGTLAATISGRVTLAAFVTVLRAFAGAAIVTVAQDHPGIDLSVHQLDDSTAAEDLLAGRTDLALVEDDAQRRRSVPRGLHYEPLYDDPFRVVVPIDWPEFDDLASIAERPWIDGSPGSAVGQAMRRVRHTSALRLPAAHLCQDFTAGLVLVSAGFAAALVPVLALWGADRERMRDVALPGLGSRRIGVLYRRSRNEPTPAVRTVLDELRAAAAHSAAS